MESLKLGEIALVENGARGFAESDKYFIVYVSDVSCNDIFPIALTKNDLAIAKNRARKNSEDLPGLNIVGRVAPYVIGFVGFVLGIAITWYSAL